jgi:hypothetical protein
LQEGLRVCEEVARFILKDTSLTKALKAIRHKAAAILAHSNVSRHLLYISRNTYVDVGREFSLLEKRSSWQGLFFANSQRVKESLRVLEEFFKLFDDRTGGNFKQLRFKFYETEKSIVKRSKALSDSKYYCRPKAFNQ